MRYQPFMTNYEIAWIAGLFEGEGCFFTNVIRKRGKEYRYPCATIKMTDKDILDRVNKLVPGGTLKTNRLVPGEKQSWTWRIHGKLLTEQFYNDIKNWLGQRRVQQANKVLGY